MRNAHQAVLKCITADWSYREDRWIGRFIVRQNISKVGNGFSRQSKSSVISLSSNVRLLDKNMDSDHSLQSPGGIYSSSLTDIKVQQQNYTKY